MIRKLFLAAVLVVGVSAPVFAQEPPPIEVSVDCRSTPERVVIVNNRSGRIKVKSVGSTYQLRAGEPIRVNRTLKTGKRIVFTFGTGKGGKRLSGSFIFDNEAHREAVVVRTDKGRIRVRCSEGTNAPVAPIDETPVIDAVELPADAPVDALELLAVLSVEPEADIEYDRARFDHWIDADGDGCDTRAEVLRVESVTTVIVGPGCRIERGTWRSVADGDTLTNPASMDINHTIPLKEAWESGAHGWTDERRRAFANDLHDDRTLQAVSVGANRQQGDRDPVSWLPADRETACQFVLDWIAIKPPGSCASMRSNRMPS